MTTRNGPETATMQETLVSLRAFNRFHTRFVGVLGASYLDSGLALADVRTLYEIVNRQPVLASDIQTELGIDAGYMSRIVARLERKGWIARGRGADARQRPIQMTAQGRAFFDALDDRTRADMEKRIAHLDPGSCGVLDEALGTVRSLLGDPALEPWTMRKFRPEDMGLIAARQTPIYAREYGWNGTFAQTALDIVTGFLRDFQPGREQGWVAERAGRMLGVVLLADARDEGGDNLGKLRLLHVEPDARGMGIGKALVRTCVDFAREAGYRGMTLWTHSILTSARRLYEAEGFAIVEQWVHEDFGVPAHAEIWRLDFDTDAKAPE